jgi:hypothetical protein
MVKKRLEQREQVRLEEEKKNNELNTDSSSN